MHEMDMGFGSDVHFLPDHDSPAGVFLFRDIPDSVHPHELDCAAAYGHNHPDVIGNDMCEHAGMASSDTAGYYRMVDQFALRVSRPAEHHVTNSPPWS